MENTYDLDTKEGMANSVRWLELLLHAVADGGVWGVPRSGTLIHINKADKIATIQGGFLPDPSLAKVFVAAGWTVKHE
jgi:hypothetical protein